MAAWLEDLTWSINPIIRMIWTSELLKEGVWPWFIGKMLGKPLGWHHPLNNQPHQYIWLYIHIQYIEYLHIGSQSPSNPGMWDVFWEPEFLGEKWWLPWQSWRVPQNPLLHFDAQDMEGWPAAARAHLPWDWMGRYTESAKNSGVMQWYPPWNLPETNSSPLKMDGWDTTFLLGRPIFRGKLLVLERAIHL